MGKPREVDDRPGCYFDACALEGDKSDYKELLGKRPVKAVISYLSIGEALGNSLRKGNGKVDAFMQLLDDLDEFIDIVDNDVPEATLEMVRRHFPHLDTGDALHLATAIHNRCFALKSIDGDLTGLPKAKVQALAKEAGLDQFAIN